MVEEMGWQDFLMKHGVGSPGYITRRMTRQYRAIKDAYPGFDELKVLHYVYANRVAAQSTVGGPQFYQLCRKNPSLIDETITQNPNLLSIIRHAILVEHPEFQNPYAPPNRFQILDRIIAEIVEVETRGWHKVPQKPLDDPKAAGGRGQLKQATASSQASQTIQPEIDLSHISKPGDALKAILAKKQEDEAATRIQSDSSFPQRTRSRPQMGDPIQTALSIFREACKESGTLFITDEWIQPRLQALEATLSNPITSEQADALCDAIEKRANLDHVIEWLQVSLLPWVKFLNVKKEFEDKLRALRKAQHDLNYQLEYVQEEMEWRSRAETHWEAAMYDGPLQAKHDAAIAVREYGHLSHPCSKCGAVKVRWFTM